MVISQFIRWLMPSMHRALRHIQGGAGIDDLAADIGCHPHLVDLHFVVGIDADFRDLGEVPAVRPLERDAFRRALR